MFKIVGILLPLPFNTVFDYKVEAGIELGQIVRVRFGRDIQIGVVWKEGKSCNLDDNKIKPIIETLNYPKLSKKLMKFIDFVATYNMSFLGLTMKMVISVKSAFEDKKTTTLYKLSGKTLAEAKLKNSEARHKVIEFLGDKATTRADIAKYCIVSSSVVTTMINSGVLEAIEIENEKTFKIPNSKYTKINLTTEQELASSNLIQKTDYGFSSTLLYGVTGSGKTEVYFEAIAKALENNKQVLIMVPEIALTTQWLKRFENRFGVKPCTWHSGLSQNDRTEHWRAIIDNRAKVIIGARSALFLPYQDLGIIVVDESHDHSFKQEDVVSYQGRDMAVVRAKMENIPIILATATPDLETICNTESGKYDILRLNSRFANATMPEVKIIDLRKDKPKKGDWGVSWLAPSLVKAIEENLKAGEQSMVFLNRRGYAPLTICRDCGHRISCPDCTSWLTEHKRNASLICHHCGHQITSPKLCPECHAENSLAACGPGVERIYEEVKQRFPNARIEVISSDITPSLTEVSNIITRMEQGKVDIIIGTQILAKGHHFPSLTLVGIVDADLGLMGSDLRASEQTFQLLSQVSGRAGRAEKKGVVYVQTLNPENEVLKALIDNDMDRFIKIEKQFRKVLKMPPFGKLAGIVVSGSDRDLAERFATYLGNIALNNDSVTTLGPTPAPIHMLRGKYRYRLLIKTATNIKIQEIIKEWLSKVNIPNKIRVNIDIDPYSFM